MLLIKSIVFDLFSSQISRHFCVLHKINFFLNILYLENTTPDTDLRVLPVCRSHSIMFVSSEPLYNKLSSGCHWTQFTPPLWPPSWQWQKVIKVKGVEVCSLCIQSFTSLQYVHVQTHTFESCMK